MEASSSKGTGTSKTLSVPRTNLDSYFAPNATVPGSRNDTDALLSTSWPAEWSENPKLLWILRRINRTDLMSKLIEAGFTDLWLPCPKYILQKVKLLSEEDRKRFLEAQNSCLDHDLPSQLSGQHLSIEDSEMMEFENVKRLGTGGNGDVHHVRDLRTGQDYARKSTPRDQFNLKRHQNVMQNFKREVSGMRRVRHHHCVDLVASFTHADSVAVFSYPVADMDLSTFLNLDLGIDQLTVLRRSVGCITAALSYLHKNHIRHDDMKPNNILIQGSNILLTDFGCCRDSSDSGVSTTFGPPDHYVPRYSAPEVYAKEPRNQLTDIWGLGCVLLEILSRLRGFKLEHMKDFWENNGSHRISFALNTAATAAWFTQLMENHPNTQHGSDRNDLMMISFIYHILLDTDRLLRPTAVQVLHKLADLKLIYPSQAGQWIGICCYSQVDTALTAATTDPLVAVPQWPLLDLANLDNHLAYMILDMHLGDIAHSENLSHLDFSGIQGRKIEHLVGPDDLETIESQTKHLLDDRLVVDGPPDIELKHAVKSLSIAGLHHTLFWVGFLNIYWKKEKVPRLRTVQLSVVPASLARQPGYGTPFVVLTFHPNEANEDEVDVFSFKAVQESWVDGLDAAGNVKRPDYRYFRRTMQLRQKEYLKRLDKRRSIKRALAVVKCYPCIRASLPCTGPRVGGCDQCIANGSFCRFDSDSIENRGGETLRYLAREKTIDELINLRWGS